MPALFHAPPLTHCLVRRRRDLAWYIGKRIKGLTVPLKVILLVIPTPVADNARQKPEPQGPGIGPGRMMQRG